MNKRKLIPIVISVILLVIAVFLFINNKNKRNISYTKLIINYQNEKTEYEEFDAGKVITVGSMNFRVAAHEPQRIILISDSEVSVGNKKMNEIEINGGKDYNICITSEECFNLSLSR